MDKETQGNPVCNIMRMQCKSVNNSQDYSVLGTVLKMA